MYNAFGCDQFITVLELLSVIVFEERNEPV